MSLEELLKACAENGSAADWEEFVRRFHSLIAIVALRTAQRWCCTSSTVVDDLTQEVYLKICRDPKRLLSEFTPHLPEKFYGFLKVLTANVVHDHFRAQRSQKRGSGHAEESVDELDMPAPATARNDAVYYDLFLKEVESALRDEPARDRTIFWLYYRYGLTAAEISSIPSTSLTVKGVESVIHRLTRKVRDDLANRKK